MIVLDIETIKEHVSSINANLLYANMKSHIRKAERYVKGLIGLAVFSIVENHANTPDESISSELKAIYDELLDLFNGIISHLAVISSMKTLSITISNDGIHRIEGENKATAYKYQIYDAEIEYRDIAYSLISDLIDYLNAVSNETVLPEWKEAEEQKTAAKSWLKPADIQKLQSVDNSAYFLHEVRSLIIEIQENEIRPLLGETKFLEIETQLAANTLTNENKNIVQLCLPAIMLGTMTLVVRRKSVEVLPIGVFKNWFNDSHTQKETVSHRERQDQEDKLKEDFFIAINKLELKLKKIFAPVPVVETPISEAEKVQIMINAKYINL